MSNTNASEKEFVESCTQPVIHSWRKGSLDSGMATIRMNNSAKIQSEFLFREGPCMTGVPSLPSLAQLSPKESKLFDEKHNMKGEMLPFPYKWLSVRNIIILSHVLLTVFATVAIFLVSYHTTMEAMQSAVKVLAASTMDTVRSQMNELFTTVSVINMDMESDYKSGALVMNNTESAVHNLLRRYHIFVAPLLAKERPIDTIYCVDRDNGVYSVGKQNGFPSDPMAVRVLTPNTSPYRLTYIIDRNCTVQNNFCTIGENPMTLVNNVTFYYKQRPFYKIALENKEKQQVLTPVYQFISGYLGFTVINPILDDSGELTFVAGSDFKLQTLSYVLNRITNNISKDQIDKSKYCKIHLIDANSKLLIASSDESLPLSYRNLDELFKYDTLSDDNEFIDRFMELYKPSDRKIWKEVYITEQRVVMIGNILRDDHLNNLIIVISMSMNILSEKMNNDFQLRIPLFTFVILLMIICISIFITKKIWRPLKRITQSLLRVANLNFDENPVFANVNSDIPLFSAPTKKNSLFSRWSKKKKVKATNDFSLLKELRNMQCALSSMVSGLKSFSKYVPLDVVSLLVKLKREAVLGVEEKELTVMFTDIADFTAMAEKMESRAFIDLMGQYFSEVSKIVVEHQGIVDKFIGDAVMAFWNAPISIENHPVLACRAALKIQQRLVQLRVEWKAKGYPDVKTRIGINTGRALVGNFGSRDRFNYTCLGDSVNLASRLENLNKIYTTDILINESTFHKVQDVMICRHIDSVVVKGKSVIARIYELIDEKSDSSVVFMKDLTLYHQGCRFYEEKKIVEAYECFKSFLSLHPLDHVARWQKEKCESLL